MPWLNTYRDYVAGNDISKSQNWIIDRYAAMVSELGLKPAVLEKISKSIRAFGHSFLSKKMNFSTIPS